VPVSDIAKLDMKLSTESYRYRVPIKFGGRVVDDVTVLNVEAACETRGGGRVEFGSGGLGSMTMGIAWAWPDPQLDDDRRLGIVRQLCERFIADFLDHSVPGHPLEICYAQSLRRAGIARELAGAAGLSTPIPPLAVLLAASAVEAAIFDAHGKALGQSSFALLGKEYVNTDLATYLGEDYRGLYLDRFVTAKPKASMPLYHLVGALDPLVNADVTAPAGDGLPETLQQWIVRDGLTHLKIKLAGDNLDWDIRRVAGTHTAATTSGRTPSQGFAYSLDFNERCESEDYVLALLDELASLCPDALGWIQYIEQPTHRDLAAHPENTMHRVAQRLPVVIDESLVDLESLRLAIAQGYSGIALKACKGHSEALLMAAVAQHDKLYLCVQDLTCIGASLLHSASLAAHIPGVAAIESNGRQYCPAGNRLWNDRYPGMFDVRDGRLPTACLDEPGLGYTRPQLDPVS
jgi:L-alanine-DL-glutamate epimerase-like enolase superfamily enzyme